MGNGGLKCWASIQFFFFFLAHSRWVGLFADTTPSPPCNYYDHVTVIIIINMYVYMVRVRVKVLYMFICNSVLPTVSGSGRVEESIGCVDPTQVATQLGSRRVDYQHCLK
jgi:hypothetical protein